MPIGAERTASGYDVALRMTGTNLYAVWHTDSSANYVSDAIGAVAPTSFALEAFESSFHQDLNGDGVIGPSGMTVIETSGSTWLTEIGNQFYLYDIGGAGPVLTLGGAAVVAGQQLWPLLADGGGGAGGGEEVGFWMARTQL